MVGTQYQVTGRQNRNDMLNQETLNESSTLNVSLMCIRSQYLNQIEKYTEFFIENKQTLQILKITMCKYDTIDVGMGVTCNFFYRNVSLKNKNVSITWIQEIYEKVGISFQTQNS
jgi:hypothetical protein